MLNAKKPALPLALLFAIAFATLPARAEVREEFHKTVAMDADGVLSLKNVNGNIKITSWDRNEIQIDAVKTAKSEEKLHEARIEVAGSGHSVDIQTKYPEHTSNAASVEYTILVPRSARLRSIETVNGNINVDGPRGSIKASTVNGKAEVWNAAAELEVTSVNGEVKASLSNAGKGRVKLNVVNGGVSLQLPASTNAHLKASTVNGNIHSDLPLTINKSKYAPGASVDSNLGSGGNSIELASVNGSIYLHKT
jgi:DUF4097 and DUF4098 domain-containing protein YvlB